MKDNFKIWNVFITLVVGVVLYFFMLPPLNLTSMEFWVFLMMMLFLFIVISFSSKIRATIMKIKRNDYSGLGKLFIVLLIIPVMKFYFTNSL